MGVEAVAGSGLGVNEVVARVGQQAELGRAVLEPDRRQVRLPQGHSGDREGVTRVSLAGPTTATALPPAECHPGALVVSDRPTARSSGEVPGLQHALQAIERAHLGLHRLRLVEPISHLRMPDSSASRATATSPHDRQTDVRTWITATLDYRLDCLGGSSAV